MEAMLLFIGLGFVNWFGTLLIVQSELFRPLRELVYKLRDRALRQALHAERQLTMFGYRWLFRLLKKVGYLVDCHMCAGTWVGMALAPFAPMVFGSGFFAYLVVGLLIKALGHFILVLQNYFTIPGNQAESAKYVDSDSDPEIWMKSTWNGKS